MKISGRLVDEIDHISRRSLVGPTELKFDKTPQLWRLVLLVTKEYDVFDMDKKRNL